MWSNYHQAYRLGIIGIAIITLLFITIEVSSAGTTGKLAGQITDETTGIGIASASVLLYKDNVATNFGAQTGMDGYYQVLNIPPGNYDIEITYVGYHDAKYTGVAINIDLTTELDAKLTPSSIAREEVEITYKKPVIQMDATASSKRIDKRIDKPNLSIPRPGKVQTLGVRSQSSAMIISPEGKMHARGGRAHSQNPSEHFPPPPHPPDFNTEEYDYIQENEFLEVINRPLSTFSIDVDAASYANCRRFINGSNRPPKDAVRIEEFINYFTYDYPQPEDKHPFSITTEMSVSPWNEDNRLIHIGLQGKSIKTENLPPSNLVFLLDVSGSMQDPNKLPLLKSAFKMLVNNLRQSDRVAIVVYAGSAGLVLPSTQGNEKDEIIAAIENLRAGGSTAGGAGIQLAYKIAKENFLKEGNNRVILATDGDFNVGVSSSSELDRMIEEKRKDGIFLTVLGFGTGNIKDGRMEQLADKGNGNYAYIDNILEAKKVFVNEIGATLFTIAKDVKIQVEFNPAKVKAYRLIGYENRMLADKDFNDDTKDAGELGAGHTVTALYEIILAGSDVELPKVDPLKYQETEFSSEAMKSDEVMTIKLRYKPPKEDTSKLITMALKDKQIALRKSSDNFRFSAAVAQFGMLLRDSKYKGKSTFESVVSLAKGSKGIDDAGYRAEFIRLVELSEQFWGQSEVNDRRTMDVRDRRDPSRYLKDRKPQQERR